MLFLHQDLLSLSFQIRNELISNCIIRMKIKYLFLLFFIFPICLGSYAQSGFGMLSGRIVNADQQPVTGASVSLEKTKLGTVTGSDGQFSLKGITPGSYIISISNVGYTAFSQNILISKGKNPFLDLQLSESKQQLDEVVVSTTKNWRHWANRH